MANKKFLVFLTVNKYLTRTVTAKTEAQAIRKAKDKIRKQVKGLRLKLKDFEDYPEASEIISN